VETVGSNLDTRGLNVMSTCLGLISLEEEGGISIVCVRHLHHHSRPVLWVKGTHPWDPTSLKNVEEWKLFYFGTKAYAFNAKIILWRDLAFPYCNTMRVTLVSSVLDP